MELLLLCWFVASFPIALLIGRFFAVGKGVDPSPSPSPLGEEGYERK